MSSHHCFNINVAKKYGITEAVLLGHIAYWIEKNWANHKNFYEGRYWTYNSTNAFAKLFPYLTKRQIEYSLNKLFKEGVIMKGNFNENPFDRSLWYALTDEGIRILQELGEDLTKIVNVDDETCKSISNIKPNIKPDINIPPEFDKSNSTPKGVVCDEPQERESEALEVKKEKSEYSDDFLRFWELYKTKRTEGKHPAFVQYQKAIKKTPPDKIYQALEAHIRHWNFNNTDSKFIPHARTWLSQQRYLDELHSKQDYGSASKEYKECVF